MDIFEYKSYKKFVNDYVKSLPNAGRGELTKISKAIKIHNTTLSQVLKGEKNLSAEQGLDLAQYIDLNEKELSYLLLLINYEKASSFKLKNHYSTQIEQITQKAKTELSFQENPYEELDHYVKSKFYSYWAYSALRILSSIPKFQTLESLSTRVGLSRQKTKEILDFLVKHKLCTKKADKYIPGPQHTHIKSNDIFINSHRLNWRTKAIEKIGDLQENELAFSAPMSLSKKEFLQIRTEINKLIKKTISTIKNNEEKPQLTACLNIDWFMF